MKKLNKAMAFLLATSLIAGMATSCSKGDSDSGSNSGKTANLVYYLWGDEGPSNKDRLAAINEKLKKDINATLEVKYIGWGDVNTKYPLLFASGEQFDMSHASPNSVMPYGKLVTQKAVVDITDMLDKTAPTLKSEIPQAAWDSAKVNGKIYGVPCNYTEFTPSGFVTRRDLQEKYGIAEVNSLETMEQYLDKAVNEEGMKALDGNSLLAMDMYRMFVDLTSTWIAEAPGISSSEMFLVAESKDKPEEIFHPAFTDEFVEFCELMREWADKGYWSKDVLSAEQGAKDNFLNGKSASFITHMADWSGTYGQYVEKLPGVETDFWCFAENDGKIRRKMGVENSTVISANSKNPEKALQAIEKFMTDEEYYNLIQYGIEGKHYEVVDGKITQPESFDPDVDGGGFSVWSLRNDKYNIPYTTEDPRRYELNDEWNKVAIDNPYVGFSFDSKPVSTEMASVSNVNAQLGTQLMLGKTKEDVKTAVESYRKQLKQAGIDKIIEEVKKQFNEYKG